MIVRVGAVASYVHVFAVAPTPALVARSVNAVMSTEATIV